MRKCEGVSLPFASDTSPKRIDREGLGNALQGLGKVKSIIIILGMPTHFASHYEERTPDSCQFISKVQSFIIR